MMQTRILRKGLYHINNIDETDYSEVVWIRKEKLDKIAMLLEEGCSEEAAVLAVDISRATYYRWKKSYQTLGLIGLEQESKRPNNVRKPMWTHQVEQRIY